MLRPFGQTRGRFWHGIRLLLQRSEKRALAALPIGNDARRSGECAVNLCEQSRPRLPQTIARAALNQCFKNFSTDGTPIHSLAEIQKGFEFPAFLARLENGLNSDFTDSFNRRKSEADGV